MPAITRRTQNVLNQVKWGAKWWLALFYSDSKSPMNMVKSLCLVRVEGCARAKWGLREAKSCGWDEQGLFERGD